MAKPSGNNFHWKTLPLTPCHHVAQEFPLCRDHRKLFSFTDMWIPEGSL